MRIAGPRGQKVSIPFRMVLEAGGKRSEKSVNCLFLMWARTLICCGHNDLKGPLGSGVRDLHYAERLTKEKESSDLAQRWEGKADKTWYFKGHSINQTFEGGLIDQECSQHVLGFMDLSTISVIEKSSDHSLHVHLIGVRGFGRWNKPGELVISRENTFKAPLFNPCPLRFAQGIRLLIGHDLEEKTKSLLESYAKEKQNPEKPIEKTEKSPEIPS